MRGNQSKKKKQLNSYIKYSSLGIQMTAIIFSGFFAGDYLDEIFQSTTPKYTIIFSLISIFSSVYYIVKKTAS